ncbi:MAG: hypothetical protein N2508_10150 [Anaerolineae bacterium]|nr:hypothetical protein [Anaerolineae bacterium]
MRLARTVDEGFLIFLEELSPAGRGTPGLRDEVRAGLAEHFAVSATFLVGSYLNGTDIQGYSIPDYLISVECDWGRMTDSRVLLTSVAEALRTHFPSVSVNGKAVALFPGEADACRLIPARLTGQTPAGHLTYEIPDGSGGWMSVCPYGYLAHLEDVDRRLEGGARSLVRLVKAWKYFRAVPISAFYLESRCIAYAALEKRMVYPLDLQRVLGLLWDDQLADAPAVDGTGGQVSARLARADRKAVFSGLRSALYYATCAVERMDQGNLSEAFRYWGRIFSGRFPACG